MSHLRVGDVLRRKRLDTRLTQKELAALVDYNHTYVSRVERGEQQPSQSYLTRCIEALDVSEIEQGELWSLFRTDSARQTKQRTGQIFDDYAPERFVDPIILADDRVLAQFFTGAKPLRALFEQLVQAPALSKRLLILYGIGGVGKSSLLQMFRLFCTDHHIPVALALRNGAKSQKEILHRWASDLDAGGLTLPCYTATLDRYYSLRARVVELERSKGRSTTETTSILLHADPLSALSGDGGTEALIGRLQRFLHKPDIDLLLNPVYGLTTAFLTDLAQVAERRRLVLMLDTFEQLTAFEAWLATVVQRLPAHVLMVIAGRKVPNWSWRGWRAQAEVHEVKELADEEVQTLIRRYAKLSYGEQPDASQIEAIARFARGLPLAAVTAVDLWQHYGKQEFQRVKPLALLDLADVLRSGVPDPLIPVFEAAAAVRWFNREILRTVVGIDLDRRYEELCRFSFVRPHPLGVALHDSVRTILDEYMQVHDPQRHHDLHERAAHYFAVCLREAAAEDTERLLLEHLYHTICADEAAGIKLFQETAEGLVRRRSFGPLRTLLNDVNTYPLRHEQSRLWRTYYSARLSSLEERFADAERVYQEIATHPHCEPKLAAYALHDCGRLLWRRRSGQPEVLDKAIGYFEQSLAQTAIDLKLAAGLLKLGMIYRDKGEWEQGLAYLHQAADFYREHQALSYLAETYHYLRQFYASQGNWRQMFALQEQAVTHLQELGNPLSQRIDLGVGVPWLWAGRYAEVVRSQEKNRILQKEIGAPESWGARDWALALSFTGQTEQAASLFMQALARDQGFLSFSSREEAVALGFYGIHLIKQGELTQALEALRRSADIKQSIQDTSYLLETLNWLGIIHEILQNWTEAKKFYLQTLSEYRWTGRRYFECGALTGLMRVNYAQGNHRAITPLLEEAERLAQQYEYNDHLASLRLIQGHLAWPAFPSTLSFYQHALIYALRYNRFLLDEVLAGRAHGSPLPSLIPYCLARGQEGRQLLRALRDWWRSDKNDIGASRPDTISPLPEGSPLLEAEQVARLREPGDGSSQRTVIDQIEAALALRVTS